MRQSIEPTYNHRKDGDQYSVTTLLNDRTLSFQKPIPDPFIYTTVRVHWWDVIKSLLRHGRVSVSVNVRGNPRIIEDVLELDGDYLGIGNSSRRENWNSHVNEQLKEISEMQGLIEDAGISRVSAGSLSEGVPAEGGTERKRAGDHSGPDEGGETPR